MERGREGPRALVIRLVRNSRRVVRNALRLIGVGGGSRRAIGRRRSGRGDENDQGQGDEDEGAKRADGGTEVFHWGNGVNYDQTWRR